MTEKKYEKKPGEFTYFLNYQKEGPDGPYYTNVHKKKKKDPVTAYAIPKDDNSILVKIDSNNILLTALATHEGTYMNGDFDDGFTFFANKGENQYGSYLRLSKVVKQVKEENAENANPERQYGS